jgi:hypothetical protein
MNLKFYQVLTLLSIITGLNSNNLLAQATNTWTPKTSLGTGRRDAVGFAIGNKGYIGTGNAYSAALADFWEFDPVANTWTQKANVPGGARSGGMGFGIGTKGYMGGGYNNSTGVYYTDFYEYDVAGNTWTAKATMPGIGGEESVSLTIGSKGYYGTGFNGNTPPYCVANFYEYDPSANTWTAKANFPGTRYGSVGFAIGNKAYVGSGSNCVTGDVTNFYEFDPIANTWTAKANHPGPARESACAFSAGSKGYLVNGRNSSTLYNDLYEYDPTTNAWATKATPLGGARLGGVAFGIGSKGYIATGYNFNLAGAAAYLNDVYEYAPCPLVGGLTITPSTTALVCNGPGTVTVAATQNNVVYYLRNDANNAIVASAAGTGSAITFNTGNISAATTFNINAVVTTGGLTFSGTAQHVLISTPHSSTGNFTWETWFKTSGNGVLFGIVSPSGTYATPGSKLLYINNGVINLDCYNLGNLQSAGNNYADNAWHHVALTVQANFSSTLDKIIIYADGVQAAQGLFDINSGAETGLVNKIGYGTSDASSSLPGTVDEVRIWNTTRTAPEVAGDMSNCLTGTETGLVGYYQFENGSGSTTVTDVAGANNNGALANMNATTAWTTGRDNCGSCSQQQATKPVFSINALTNQSPAPLASTVICNGAAAISFSTQTGVNYYLRNDANNAVLSGPVAGTGGTVTLGSGNVTASSTLNVLGKKLSGGLTFDGVNDRVTVPYSAAFNFGTTVDFTYEAMIKFTAGQANYAGIITKANSGSPFSQMVIYNNRIAAEVFTSANLGVGNGLVGTTALNDGKWHHVAMVVTRSTNNIKLYVDGVAEVNVTNAIIGGNLNETNGINIGSDRGTGVFFNGSIDEARVWNTARSVSQLTANASACLTGAETGLVAYYQFEDGANSMLARDLTSNSNTGVLVNMNTAMAWSSGVENCGCTLQMTAKPTLVVNGLANQPVTATLTDICGSGSTTVNSAGSEAGINYYLRDNSNNTVVTGPVIGTGSALSFTTGNITATKTYNVLAKKITGGLTFDGVDDYVSGVATSSVQSLGLAPFTMEAWIYPTNLSGNRSIIRKDGDYNFMLISGALVAEGYSGSTSFVRTTASSVLSVNQWVHVAAVWNGSTFTLYVNGVAVSSSNSSGTSAVVTNLSIGRSTNFNEPFEGKMDELRIWNTTRTVSQLTTNVTACLTGTETGLAAYYKFEDGAGSTTLTDFAGGDNNGTLTNMAVTTAWSTGVENCGCTLQMTNTPTVTVNTIPTISANSATICSGASVVVAPTGAATYTITGGTFTVTPGITTSYSVTGTGSNNCAASNTAVISVSVNATPTLAVNSATICSGASVAITPTGAGTYTITGNTFTVTPGVTTSYTVTGTGTNNCVAGNAVVSTVSVNATPTLAVNSATICSGNPVAIVPTGAATYTITGGTFNVSPNATTSYSITGTGAGNCAASNTIVSTVSVNATPTLAVNSATICSGNSVAIVPTGAGTYTITGGTFNVSPNATTSYSITGTGAGNCAASNTIVSTVSVNVTPTLTVNSATICSGNSAAIVPTGAATYTITGGTFTVSPNTTSSYSVTGTGTNNCAASNTIVSTVSVNVTPTLTVNSATICSGNSVAIVPTGAGTYTITGGTFTVSPNTTSSYSVTGTGTNNCAALNTVVSTVSVNTTPTLTVNSATICSGNSVAIVPTGAATYTITGGTFTVSPNTTTSYSVTGTGTNDCPAGNTIVSTVSVNTTPTLTVNNAAICSGNSVVIAPTGAATYTISGGSFTVSPATTTTYSVTGTGTNNCLSSNTAISTVSVSTTPTVMVSDATICEGSSFVITPTGADTYSISGNSFTVTPATTTTYSITGSSINGCGAPTSAVMTLSVNANPTVTVNSATICAGSPVVIAPIGAITYTISGNTFTVSPTSNSSYSVTGTDANGCTSSEAVSSVSVNALPTIMATTSNATVCINTTVTLTAVGAVSYSWSTAQTQSVIAVTPTVSGSETYTVTGTDANGCVNTAMVTQVADNCTGIKTDANSTLIFGVYPNPNTGRFTVETNENVHITVLNSIGQTVYTETTRDIKTNISIENLASGIYFIKAVANGNQQVVKLVKD